MVYISQYVVQYTTVVTIAFFVCGFIVILLLLLQAILHRLLDVILLLFGMARVVCCTRGRCYFIDCWSCLCNSYGMRLIVKHL